MISILKSVKRLSFVPLIFCTLLFGVFLVSFTGYEARAQNMGDTNPCVNETTTYTCADCSGNPSNYQNFTWYPPASDICTAVPMGYSLLVTWKKSGSYQIFASWASGSGQNYTQQNGLFANITVKDLPAVSVSSSAMEAAPGQVVILSAGGSASTYSWSGTGLFGTSGPSVPAQIPTDITKTTYDVTGLLQWLLNHD